MAASGRFREPYLRCLTIKTRFWPTWLEESVEEDAQHLYSCPLKKLPNKTRCVLVFFSFFQHWPTISLLLVVSSMLVNSKDAAIPGEVIW